MKKMRKTYFVEWTFWATFRASHRWSRPLPKTLRNWKFIFAILMTCRDEFLVKLWSYWLHNFFWISCKKLKWILRTSSKAVILAATEIFDVGIVGFADFKTVGELIDPAGAGVLGLTWLCTFWLFCKFCICFVTVGEFDLAGAFENLAAGVVELGTPEKAEGILRGVGLCACTGVAIFTAGDGAVWTDCTILVGNSYQKLI